MPSLAARAIRFIFDWNLRPGGKRIFSSTENTRTSIQTLYLRPQSYAPPASLGVDVTVERIDMIDGPLYRVSIQPLNGAKKDQRGALLYLHGGAWLHEITSAHWQLVAHLARTTGLDVLVPIYPLIPRPTATAVQVIKSLIEICQDSTQPIVCIAGDSAGGNIALSLAQQLQLKTPEIAAKLQSIVLISPVLDATFAHPDITEYEKRDPWLAVPGLKVVAQHWAGDTPLSNPVVSPLFGDISNLPPLLLLSGTDDLLNADARRLSARFQGQDMNACVAGSVTLDKFEYVETDQMIHVYPLLPCWEGEQARKKISDFIVKNGNKEGL